MMTDDAPLDRAASNMMEDDIKNYSLVWIDVLYNILTVPTGCEHLRRGNVHDKRKAIINYVLEYEYKEDRALSAAQAQSVRE